MKALGFRVWDVEAEEYLPNSNGSCDGVLGISADGKNVIWLEDGEITLFEAGRSVIIERDTGLTDKNGKRICDGDIISLEDEKELASVLWLDDKAMFGLKWLDCGVKDKLDYWIVCKGPVEVINNIHENPELLKGEEDEEEG